VAIGPESGRIAGHFLWLILVIFALGRFEILIVFAAPPASAHLSTEH
jgi:hypothetical protein